MQEWMWVAGWIALIAIAAGMLDILQVLRSIRDSLEEIRCKLEDRDEAQEDYSDLPYGPP